METQENGLNYVNHKRGAQEERLRMSSHKQPTCLSTQVKYVI